MMNLILGFAAKAIADEYESSLVSSGSAEYQETLSFASPASNSICRMFLRETVAVGELVSRSKIRSVSSPLRWAKVGVQARGRNP